MSTVRRYVEWQDGANWPTTCRYIRPTPRKSQFVRIVDGIVELPRRAQWARRIERCDQFGKLVSLAITAPAAFAAVQFQAQPASPCSTGESGFTKNTSDEHPHSR